MRYIKYYIALVASLSIFNCEAISGNGKVTIEKRTVNSVSNLTINGPFKIIFSDNPHSDFFIKIETDENLQQYVTVSQIKGGASFVNIKPGVDIDKFTRMVLYVDNHDFRSLSINSNTTEESDLLLPVTCYINHLKISGSIPISIKIQVICHRVTHLSDPAYAKINYAKLVVEINNARTTRLSGDIEEADILNNGTGQVSAFGLNADLLRVKNNTAAAVEVFSNRNFAINNAGSGHVYYKGEGKLSELKASVKETVCWEGNGDTISSLTGTLNLSVARPENRKIEFNSDSLFQIMVERDQNHRKHPFDSTMALAAKDDDIENFKCLKWYLEKYGYPELRTYPVNQMFPTLFDHIDNYENFIQVKDILLKAVKEGKLLANTYAYSCDRSMIAGHKKPYYYYFFPDSDWDIQNKPTKNEVQEINKHRKEINLPDYPKLLNGKYF